MYQARAVSNAGSIARVTGKPSWRYARGTQSATLCRANIHEIRPLCKIVQYAVEARVAAASRLG